MNGTVINIARIDIHMPSPGVLLHSEAIVSKLGQFADGGGALAGTVIDRATAAGVRCTPAELRQLGSIWASYRGHFANASSHRLQQRLHARHPWLAPLTTTRRRFDHRLEGRRVTVRIHHP